MTEAEAIVRALAAEAPIEAGYADRAIGDEPGYDCAFAACGVSGGWTQLGERPDIHRPTCPWRLAREWVAEHPEEKTAPATRLGPGVRCRVLIDGEDVTDQVRSSGIDWADFYGPDGEPVRRFGRVEVFPE